MGEGNSLVNTKSLKSCLPQTWGNERVEHLIYKRIKCWDYKKIQTAASLGFESSEGFKKDAKSVTISEIFADFCSEASGNIKIRDISASLQAFQTYKIALFDIIEDNHLTVFGQPTILGAFGKDYTKDLFKSYSRAVNLLSKELEENKIKNASRLAKLQYDKTIEADKIRNREYALLPAPEDAVSNHEKISGGTAKFISPLSGGNKELEIIISSLADAMVCCDDLADMARGDDLKNKKCTIPLSFLEKKIGKIENYTLTEIMEFIKMGISIDNTKEYIKAKISKAEKKIKICNFAKNNLINVFIKEINKFVRCFPEDYF